MRRVLVIMKAVRGCNLACDYCYMGAPGEQRHEVMPESVLEAVMASVADLHPERAEFCWHGGEPLLASQDFYDRALELEQAYFRGVKVTNSMQSNGTLLTEGWVSFLKSRRIGLGISFDGPRLLSDHHRVDRQGRSSFSQVIRGLGLLEAQGVNVNIIPVVSSQAADSAQEVFDFFKGLGLTNFAYTPCSTRASVVGATPISVSEWRRFLCDSFDCWLREDDPTIRIRFISELLCAMLGGNTHLCVFERGRCCHEFTTVDVDGDVYPCDSYYDPSNRLGNIMSNSLVEIRESADFSAFREKVTARALECEQCEYEPYCRGGCTALRDDATGRNRYCEAVKGLVDHIDGVIAGGYPR